LARRPGKGDQNGHNPIECEWAVDQEINIKNDVDLRHRDSQAFRGFSGVLQSRAERCQKCHDTFGTVPHSKQVSKRSTEIVYAKAFSFSRKYQKNVLARLHFPPQGSVTCSERFFLSPRLLSIVLTDIFGCHVSISVSPSIKAASLRIRIELIVIVGLPLSPSHSRFQIITLILCDLDSLKFCRISL